MAGHDRRRSCFRRGRRVHRPDPQLDGDQRQQLLARDGRPRGLGRGRRERPDEAAHLRARDEAPRHGQAPLFRVESRTRRDVLLPAALLALTACSGSCGGNAPTTVRLKGRTIQVALFATEKSRHAASLILRTLEDGHAYLFLWPRERFMKMEPAALDVAFLDRSGKILEIARLDREKEEGVMPESQAGL